MDDKELTSSEKKLRVFKISQVCQHCIHDWELEDI